MQRIAPDGSGVCARANRGLALVEKTSGDKDSLKYHQSKLPLADLMEGLIGRPGNLINAADASAQTLVADQTGLRKNEGKDLLVYLE